MSAARDRATSFGGVAELYDRRRPGYPPRLYDDVLAAVPGASRAIEAGCGTGRATVELARRGLEVVAVEPDAEMAAVARRAAEGLRVELRQGRFEDWDGPQSSFDLVVSAQAWHWVDFESGMEVVRRALRPGGVLAVWWSRNGALEPAMREALDAAYRRHAPELAHDFVPTPAFAAGARLDGFEPIEARTYDWTAEYAAAAFAEFLATHSDHILLETARREALMKAVVEAIERIGGGRLVYPYRTFLLLARREGRRAAAGLER